MSLIDALRSAAQTDEGFVFVDRRERETTLSFAELYARSEQVAARLAEAGITRGQRVAIVLPTGPDFLCALFGCQRLGAVPVPLYPPVRLGRLNTYIERTAAMLRASDAKLLLTEPRIYRVLGEVRQRVPVPVRMASELVSGTAYDGPPPSDDDLGLVQFSSGTTHHPKPVALTHRALLANVYAINTQLPRDVARVGVCWLPLYHDMGLVGCVFTAVCAPGRLVLLPPELFLVKPALWLRAISRHRAIVSPAPNFAYSLCTERIADAELDGVDLSCWRLALNGAEPVAPASLRDFSARFAAWGLRDTALTPVYGLAEAALAVTFSAVDAAPTYRRVDATALHRDGRLVPADDGLELVGVGSALPGFAIALRRPDGAACEPGQVGALWVRGPSLMQGYLDRDEQPLEDGWLNTGDLGAELDGELFIVGRARDVIVLRGENHAPQDIEQAVSALDAVRTGCVVAVGEHSDEGERLLVFAECRTPSDDTAEAVIAATRAACGHAPDLVLLLEPGTLPRTSSGKLRRAETLRQHRAGTLAPPEQLTTLRLAGRLARSAWGHLRARVSS